MDYINFAKGDYADVDFQISYSPCITLQRRLQYLACQVDWRAQQNLKPLSKYRGFFFVIATALRVINLQNHLQNTALTR